MMRALCCALVTIWLTPVFAATICLDPGHPSEIGRGASGKKHTELQVAWDVSLKLKALLEKAGHKVVMTKSKVDQMVKNRDRAAIANKAKAHLMLRLHLDAAPERGFATFYPDRQGTNQGKTGPSKSVIESSSRMARPFHEAVMKSLDGQLGDRGVRTEQQTAVGAKNGALIGSIFSEVPVLLVEMAVITQPKDEAFIGSPNGQKAMAKALAAGVEAALKAEAQARKPRKPGSAH